MSDSQDQTFGSVLAELLRRGFQRVDGRAGPEARIYTVCHFCDGTDAKRAPAIRPSLELVEHAPDCLLARHLPRIRAMMNEGTT